MTTTNCFSLEGRNAVVTGGAGGFGRQIVRGLAQAGATTFMSSRDSAKARKCAEALRADGLDVRACTLDQASEASVLQLRDNLIEQVGRVHILVNNAVARPMQDWSDPLETFARSMAVNMTGTFTMVRVFGDHMAAHGGGSIINISSIYGMVGPDFTLYEGLNMHAAPDYFVHKGGMTQLTRYAAAKLGPAGVRVNAVCPGGLLDRQDPTFIKRYNARTFLNRLAGETDLSGVIVFLASDASAYVTGANIPVDGGLTAK